MKTKLAGILARMTVFSISEMESHLKILSQEFKVMEYTTSSLECAEGDKFHGGLVLREIVCLKRPYIV